MATSSSSSHEGLNTSYFDHFTCNICLEVLREPVQCTRNEHYFCKSCITQHLTRSQTCPVCQDGLTTTTLRPAPRVVANFLEQFQPSTCRYANRGCTASVRHEALLSHHEECGFAPVQCSNDGCEETMNRQDLASHEESCGFRPVTCEECKDRMSQKEFVRHPCVFLKEIDKNRVSIVEVQKILREIQEEQRRQGEQIQQLLTRDETKSQPKEASRPQVTEGLQNEQASRRSEVVQRSNASTKRKQRGAAKEQQGNLTDDKSSISQAFSSGVQLQAIEDKKIFVAGFDTSCEVFNWSTQKWSLYKDILFFNHRNGVSFVYDNKIVLCGGTGTNRIECVNISSDISSSVLPSLLPEVCAKGALYGDTIVTVGEFISETSLKAPYSTSTICPVFSKEELSSRGRELEKGQRAKLSSHGVTYVENHGVVVVGGLLALTFPRYEERRNEVLLYKPTTKKLHRLAPLPYKVTDMAVVAYKDNVIIMGGEKVNEQTSNDVLMYNLTTQQCSRLPKMLEERSRFAAVMIGDTIIVIGGNPRKYECFRFQDISETPKTAEYLVLGEKTWKKLPPMKYKRESTTACVVP